MIRMRRRDFLARAIRIGLSGTAGTFLLQGCSNPEILNALSEASKYAGSVTKSYHAVSKALEDITPEQEYYIGRTIGAVVLDKYAPYKKQKLNRYLNNLGQSLASFSDLPELFDGYHFQALDSSDINAFATPSGLVFVTRGLINCCTSEGALASVLAHEIGHVQLKHGLKSIKTDRITKATSIIALEGTKAFMDSDDADLLENFEDSINDIASSMINKGYSRASELDADNAAVEILKRVGYDPHELIDMLTVMDEKLKPGGLDFANTHPKPKSRIENLEETVGKRTSSEPIPLARTKRFEAAVSGV